MKKENFICGLLTAVGLMMICIAVVLQNDASLSVEEIDIKSMAAASNMYVKDKNNSNSKAVFQEVEMQVAPASVDILAESIVYDGMTLEELAAKIDRNLGNGYIAGKGMVVASYCLEKGVDPYIATAIMLHETGCRAKCSGLVRQCNNVGGQKGSPGCGGTSYKRFPTLDDGIRAFIDNIYRNYVRYGLTTADTMNPKYAENPMWSTNVNRYIAKIKNN